MRPRDVWIVYRKELRETLRDRRTLAVMILLPLLLYPVLTVIVSEWVLSHELERRATASKVRVVGAIEEAGELVTALRAPLEREAPLEVVVTAGPWTRPPAAAGKDGLGEVHAVVEVPPGFRAALAEGRAAELRIYYDAADDDSSQAHDRIGRAVAKMAAVEKARRLGARGLDAGFADPIALADVDLASRARLGRKEISKTLPFFLILMTILGSFYPAIDLTAGEKERGTLEPLLATPMSRHAIVGGKFLCVASVSALTALLNVLCMATAALWIARSVARAAGKGVDLGGILGAFPWGAALVALIALGGATLLFSGLMMAVASLARTFKEAQNYLTPVHMVFTIPAMVALLPGTSLDWGTALIPVANVTLLLKDVIAGTLALGPAAVAVGAIGLYAGLAMAMAARIYDSERLLFAPDAPHVKKSLKARLEELFGRSERRAPPGELGPAEALALFAVVAVLYVVVIGPIFQSRGLSGIVASQWLCFAAPCLWLARRRAGGARETLALHPPTLPQAVGSVLVGLSAWGVVAFAILPIQNRIAPVPKEVTDELQRMLMPEGTSVAMMLFAAAVTPGICEELLCRGVLARSLRGSLGTSGAIIASAALFALLHMSFYRLLPTFTLGVLLAFVALSARTTIASMIVHALNNASIALLELEALQPYGKWLEEHSFFTAAAFLVLLATGLYLVAGRKEGEK